MRYFLALSLFPLLLTACVPLAGNNSTSTQSVKIEPSPVFTPIPTFTPAPLPTSTPPAALGTVALDFVALLCNAQWMNGAHKLASCPSPVSDLSDGYATSFDPSLEGLPKNVPILLMIPNANALFLRYPSFAVRAGDRFRTSLRCPTSMVCDVQFALEYYDAKGKYHDSLMNWNYKFGDAQIDVDSDLSSLAGQSVDFVLVLRLFHTIANSQQDNGLWIAPHIYRPLK